MIHVCYGLYDRDGRYSKFVGTSIVSIFENTQENVTVHILHDNTLTDDNYDKFNYIANKYNQKIKFYNVEALVPDKVEDMKKEMSSILKSHFSIATLYRLLIPQLISELPKIIYLDADIIVNRNIKDLWDINVNNHSLAAVSEILIDVEFQKNKRVKYLINAGLVKDEDYFNAGVLVINLNRWRNNDDLSKGYKFVCNHPECIYFDQDILNYCFSKDYVKLDADFDIFLTTERILHKPYKIKKAIYHFIYTTLQFNMNDIFNRLFFEYFIKTPWFNINFISNISNKIIEIYDNRQKMFLQNISMMNGRKIIFFTERHNFESVKKIFNISDETYFVDASEANSYNKLIEIMKKDKEKYCFLLLIGNYFAFKNVLINQKFVEGRDFVNAMQFLPLQYYSGISFESHSIIRSM